MPAINYLKTMYFSQLLVAQKADIAGQRFGANARRTELAGEFMEGAVGQKNRGVLGTRRGKGPRLARCLNSMSQSVPLYLADGGRL